MDEDIALKATARKGQEFDSLSFRQATGPVGSRITYAKQAVLPHSHLWECARLLSGVSKVRFLDAA